MSAPISIQPQPTWSDEDRARAEHYALIARLFHAAPDAALLAALAQAGQTLGGEGGELPRAWAVLGAAAQAMPQQAVADEFDALFVSVGKPDVMSNGSWYLTGFLQEEPLAELRDDLAALGLGRRPGVTETEFGEVVAQLGERLFLQEAGEVPGAVAHHLGLADADEERVELVGHRLRRHRLRGGAQGGPGARQLAALAAERSAGLRKRRQQCGVGRGVEQAGDQRVVLGARAVLVRPGRLRLKGDDGARGVFHSASFIQ